MNRIELIQEIFKRTNFQTYLEIGSQRGVSFLPIYCKYKIAVDPQFLIKKRKKLKWYVKNPNNLRNQYFEETSDSFFQNRKNILVKRKLDVVLVDGLHTFRASLLDVLNSIKYLNEDGVVIMHDCLPPHPMAALPTDQFPTEEEQKAKGWTGQWCGDVWKTIVYLRKEYPSFLEAFVLDTDFGLGIVRIKKKGPLHFEINEKLFDEINKINFENIMGKELATIIDLRKVKSLEDMVNNVMVSHHNLTH